MVTPKSYKQFLSQGICDEQMLADVIYSYNKRAKNFRDKSRQYRDECRYNHISDKYDNEGKALTKMEMYYGKKHTLLMKLYADKAVCIHRHKVKERVRVYDYQEEYATVKGFYSGYYYDWERKEDVWFVDYRRETYRYYLCFKIGDKAFHSPIKQDLDKFLRERQFSNLEVVDLPDDFYTHGQDTMGLLSVQFCDKVYDRFLS